MMVCTLISGNQTLFDPIVYQVATDFGESTRIEIMEGWYANNSFPNGFRQVTFVNHVKHGGYAEYIDILNRYTGSTDPAERRECLVALCAAVDPSLISNTFSLMISLKDLGLLLELTKNTDVIEYVWAFYRLNEKILNGIFPDLTNFYILMAHQMSTKIKSQELQVISQKLIFPFSDYVQAILMKRNLALNIRIQ
jgi:hypothetical protein